MKKLLVLAALAAGLIATPAMAKEGVYLGVGLAFNNIIGSDVNVYDPATGLGFRVGYNFGSISLEGNIVKSSHTAKPGYADATFSVVSIDLKLSFSQTHDPTQAFLLIGLGSYDLDVDNGNLIEGSGFNIGGGIEHFFNEQVALNLAGIYRFITYNRVNGFSVPNGDGDTFTLEAGLNLYF